MMGMTWGQQGRRGQHGWRPRRPQTWGPHGDLLAAMGTMWGQLGQCGDDEDDMETMGTMWGPQGPRGDNEITKNAITFERIKIIEFCLKILDP